MLDALSALLFQALATFIGALFATIYLVPKVIAIVHFKHLMDNPNERSSHTTATPSLGGVAFYLIFILSMYFNDRYDTHNISMCILPGLTVLFFLGLKDDLVVLSSRTKLIGQIVSCCFVILHYKFEIEGFHGFFGVYHLPGWLGGVIALLIMLTVINAFNLIDGIDGLAASTGIVSFSCFALLFFFLQRPFLALSALTMVGILAGFLLFNLSRKEKRRIFMGDTGSMIIGFLVAVMCVRLMSMGETELRLLPFNSINIPVILVAIVMLPLYDVVRVFTLRILAGRNPFSPDRNHLHHVLLDAYQISHRRTSFIIAASSATWVLILYVLIRFTNLWITGGAIIFGAMWLSWYLQGLKKSHRTTQELAGAITNYHYQETIVEARRDKKKLVS